MAGILITVHQPARRHRHRRRAAGHAVRRGRPALLAADGRRRPVRADPGAADLGRHRHPRHPLGLRGRPRQRHRRPDPRPAQGAARRRRRDHDVRARPGPAEAPVPRHRRPLLRRRLVAAQVPAHARRARAATRPPPSAPPRRPSSRARATPRSTRSRSTRSSWRSASAWSRSSTRTAGGTLLPRVGTIRRQIASELGMRHPARAHPRRRGARLARVRHARARHRGRPRRRHGRPPARDGPRRRHGPARRHPDHRAGLRPARGLDPRARPRRGRGAGLDGRRRRVGRRHPPHRDDPRQRVGAAHPPGDPPAARPAQGGQRGGRRRGRARTCCRSARSSACCRRCCARASRSATSARSSRRSATRRASPATRRCSPSTPARRSAARSSRPTWTREDTLRAIALDPHARAGDRRVARADRRRRVPGHGPEPRRTRSSRRCAAQVEQALARGGRPVLLCSARVRRHLRRLCEQRLPQLAVCSYNEIAAGRRRRDHRRASASAGPRWLECAKNYWTAVLVPGRSCRHRKQWTT